MTCRALLTQAEYFKNIVEMEDSLMFSRTLLVFFILLSSFARLEAQTGGTPTNAAHRDWHAVERLKPHTVLTVQLRSGEWLRGNFVSATDAKLQIEQEVLPGGSGLLTLRDLKRDEVNRVYRISRPLSKLTRQIIGGAIGLGIALAAGAIADSQAKSHEDDGLVALSLGLIAVPVGASVGGHTHGHERSKLVYESP
jgi:hypothetical protein